MSKVTQAVIMVGGKGTRLRPLTDTMSKPILPVLDRPCLSYLIRSMVDGGIKEIILACGYRSEQMAEAIGDGSEYGIKIEYSYEDGPMGTAGAMKLLEDRLDDVFVAANGDVMASLDLKGEIETHTSSGASVTILLNAVDNPTEFGIARTDEDNRILEFKEKPKPEEVFSNLINAGVYIVNKDVLSFVPKGQMYDFSKELIPVLMERGYRIQGHMLNGVWIDVGRPSDLIRANKVMAERCAKISDRKEFGDSQIDGIFYAGKGCEIISSVLHDSVISQHSKIVKTEMSDSLIFQGCHIEGSDVRNSIIGKDCVIRNSTIEGQVLGDGTRIENNKEMLP